LIRAGVKSGIFRKGDFNEGGAGGDGVGLFCIGNEAASSNAAA
jgi:hypothetical protein